MSMILNTREMPYVLRVPMYGSNVYTVNHSRHPDKQSVLDAYAAYMKANPGDNRAFPGKFTPSGILKRLPVTHQPA